MREAIENPYANQRVVVTGASRGIGAAIARALLSEGAHVALIARDGERLRALCTIGHGVALPADLRTADPSELMTRAFDALGGVDVLVNCAGVVEYAGVGEIQAAAVEHQLRVNFVAPLLLSQAAAGHMVAQGSGDIVFVASTLGLRPVPLTAVYSASKAALISLTKTLALELSPRGVRVNAIAPGVVDTDMIRVPRRMPGEPALTEAQASARVDAQLSRLKDAPLLKRLGEPLDVVVALRYLLASNWATGTVLSVDGGFSLGG